MAGSLAGLAEHGLMFPLDTIKTLSQCGDGCKRQGQQDVFCLRAAKALVRDAHILRLWRGVGAVTVACVPAHACYFGLFEAVRSTGRNDVFANGLAGCVAAVGHDVIMTPADVAKQRLQLGYHTGFLDCFLSILKNGGVSALYRSLPTTLIMNAPYGAVSVATNEYIKTRWRRHCGSRDLPVSSLLCSGGIAGALASLTTTPLDVVKTRLQTQGLALSDSSTTTEKKATHWRRRQVVMPESQRGYSSTSLKYRGFLDAAFDVWRTDGLRGFFRGAAVRALAQAPSVAIVWTTYELFIKLLSSPPRSS